MSFNQVGGLDLEEARRLISFPVKLEKVYTQEEDRVKKNAVTRFTLEEGKRILGLVSPKRKVIPYSEMMGWVVDELQEVGVDFKLLESTLTSSADNLFQQYLFDTNIDNPDGLEISPMIVMKGSYVSTPLRIDIGTYRFVCANGALVGNTIKTIVLKANDLNGLMRHTLREDISAGIEAMKSISHRYAELAREDMETYMLGMLTSSKVPVSLKKAMFEFWESDGTLLKLTDKVLKNDSFLALEADGDILRTMTGENIAEIQEKKSAWTLYNDATEIATHSAKNVVTQNIFFNSISDVFVA